MQQSCRIGWRTGIARPLRQFSWRDLMHSNQQTVVIYVALFEEETILPDCLHELPLLFLLQEEFSVFALQVQLLLGYGRIATEDSRGCEFVTWSVQDARAPVGRL